MGKKKTEWYEELFENYGESYDRESYVKGTSGECDFIEKEIDYRKDFKIIDIGCGTGRHSVELASRGYDISGVDLSPSMLKRAREKADQRGLKIEFVECDACSLSYRAEFDLAIMICEAAFPLMESDKKNFQILESAARALKPGGKLIFTTLNGLFPLFHSLKDFHNAELGNGHMELKESSFDLMTFRDKNITVVKDDDGYKKEIECNERYYVPPEITWMLYSLGFSEVDIFGAKLGAFSREDTLTTEDFEMLVIAKK